jgi:hypothetical protein
MDAFELSSGFQSACVVIAGAELDVFTILHARPMSAAQLASRIKGDQRATSILLDALASMRLLAKKGAVGGESRGASSTYSVPPRVAEGLTETGSRCMLGMVRHQGNCLRRWGHPPSRRARSGAPAGRRSRERC